LNQFEIWWADLPKPAGRRPVLLLSRASAYSYLHKFIVAEITTTIRGTPIEIPVGSREGLSKHCVVNCDNLRTIAKACLIRKPGAFEPEPYSGNQARSWLCVWLGGID